MAPGAGVFSSPMRLRVWVGILLAVALGASSGLSSLCAGHCGSRVNAAATQHHRTSQQGVESQGAACSGCSSTNGDNALRMADCANLLATDLLLEHPFSLAEPGASQRKLGPASAFTSAVDTLNNRRDNDRVWPMDAHQPLADFNVSRVTLRI